MDLELIRIFVKVVQNNSFSRAAEVLRLPKSTVSKAVTRLEKESGTKLLLRTTRSLTLTAAGRAFHEACLGPVQSLEDARKSLDGNDSILTGRLRLTAPEDLGISIVMPEIARLARLHLGLSFEMVYTDEVLDLVKDGFDLAIRIGRLRESRLKAKRAGEVRLVTVASPGYLKKAPKLEKPTDLPAHLCMGLSSSLIAKGWPLSSKRETIKVPVAPRILCNQTSSLRRAALSDGGVAFIPQYLCAADLEAGRLVRVLPEWSAPGMPVSVLSPLATSSSARLKIVVDSLTRALGQALR